MLTNLLAAVLIVVAQPWGDIPSPGEPPAPGDWTDGVQDSKDNLDAAIESIDQTGEQTNDFITQILLDVQGLLENALAQLNTLSEDLTSINGVSILPDPDSLVFGYAKWLLSGTVIRELVGPTLAPIGTGMLILMIAVVFLTASHVTLYVATMFISFARCAIKFVLQFIPGFG